MNCCRSLCLSILALSFLCDATNAQWPHVPQANHNAPVWQQMGAMNPYHRQSHNPVWRLYSPIQTHHQPITFNQPMPLPITYVQPAPVISYAPAVQTQMFETPLEFQGPFLQGDIEYPIAAATIYDSFTQHDLAPGMPIEGSNDLMLSDSQSSSYIIGEVILDNDSSPRPTMEETPLLVEQQDSLSDMIAEQADEPTESNTVVEGADTNEDRQELDRLQSELNQQTAANQEMAIMVRELENRLAAASAEKQIVDATSKYEKMLEAANKESAWMETKLRREAKRAKDQLKKAEAKAKKDRKDLLKRLKTVESKLKNAQSNPKTKNNASNKNKKPRKTGEKKMADKASNGGKQRMTLAQRAAEKRNAREKSSQNDEAGRSTGSEKPTARAKKKMTLAQRAAEKRKMRDDSGQKNAESAKAKMKAAKAKDESQSKLDSQGSGKKRTNSANRLTTEMEKQIERAVGKIERRFSAKIERLKDEDGTDEEIGKLRKEMKIQIEKMETRIRNRYQKRIEAMKRAEK